MPIFAVHIYPTVRVKVAEVEADNALQAAKKINQELNLHDVLDGHRTPHGVESFEWDEGQTKVALVDPLLPNGEVDYDNTAYLDLVAEVELVDGKTMEELAAERAGQAVAFSNELSLAVGDLSSVAQSFGVGALVDLLRLQTAILEGSEPGSNDWSGSRVLELVKTLPSADKWVPYIAGEEVNHRQVERNSGG